MDNFKCRVCGSRDYIKNYSFYECSTCSTMFREVEKFSLNRELKVKYLDNYKLDEWGEIDFKYIYDSGVDLRACIEEPITIVPYYYHATLNHNEQKYISMYAWISFGIQVQPSHYDMDIKLYARSGLASKHGVGLRNFVGVVDSTYRGQVMGAFVNLGSENYTINPGDRVAQMVVEKRLDVDIVPVDELDDTERGEGGFNSTGKN